LTSKADSANRSDGITRLREHLGLPELHYQDISMMVGVRQALERWPLLGESCTRALGELGNPAAPAPKATVP